jgi:hypothetical protein
MYINNNINIIINNNNININNNIIINNSNNKYRPKRMEEKTEKRIEE